MVLAIAAIALGDVAAAVDPRRSAPARAAAVVAVVAQAGLALGRHRACRGAAGARRVHRSGRGHGRWPARASSLVLLACGLAELAWRGADAALHAWPVAVAARRGAARAGLDGAEGRRALATAAAS